MPLHVLVPDRTGDLEPVIEREIFGVDTVFHMHTTARPDDIPDEHWGAADVVIVNARMPIRGATIGKLASCKIVVRSGAGFDNFDCEAMGRAGIAACNTPDYHQGEIADHAIGLFLALRRGILGYSQRIAADPLTGFQWGGAPLARRIEGSTFGIVGIGRIGKGAARRALGFGTEVVFYDPYVAADDPGVAGCRKLESLDELFAIADAVSVHCPLTPETRGMVGAALFARMKPGAILINTARGPVVDAEAVVDALAAGRLGGACLDVLPNEPPQPGDRIAAIHQNPPAWARGRLILTPHAAFFSPESLRDLRRLAAETARDYLAGAPPRNCVNREWLIARQSA
jgi:phosphoglycerate dehydrogenase-like enzyme